MGNNPFATSAAATNWQPAYQRGLNPALRLLNTLSPEAAGQAVAQLFFTPPHHHRPADLWYESSGGQHVEVFHNLMKLAGYRWGAGELRALLVHDWGCSAADMLPLVAPLAESGHSVFALDAPAHGLSPRRQTDLVDFAQAVEAMIAQHGAFDVVIAHGVGAAATLLALAANPRLGVGQLLLLAPAAHLVDHFNRFFETLNLPESVAQSALTHISRRVWQPFEQVSAAVAVRSVRQSGFIIHDYDDALIPFSRAELIARNWPGARLLATSGLGHDLAGRGEIIALVADLYSQAHALE